MKALKVLDAEELYDRLYDVTLMDEALIDKSTNKNASRIGLTVFRFKNLVLVIQFVP